MEAVIIRFLVAVIGNVARFRFALAAHYSAQQSPLPGASRHRRPGTSHPRAWPRSLIFPCVRCLSWQPRFRHMSPQ